MYSAPKFIETDMDGTVFATVERRDNGDQNYVTRHWHEVLELIYCYEGKNKRSASPYFQASLWIPSGFDGNPFDIF